MIKVIIDKLHSKEHYNVSKCVDVAKGRYELVTTFKGAFKKIKRVWLLKKR